MISVCSVVEKKKMTRNPKCIKPLSTRNTQKDLLFPEESYAIRGAVLEVYREMGCGFLEAVYQECLEKELGLRGIPFIAYPDLKLMYKGEPLSEHTSRI